jgi:hypothetical protein
VTFFHAYSIHPFYFWNFVLNLVMTMGAVASRFTKLQQFMAGRLAGKRGHAAIQDLQRADGQVLGEWIEHVRKALAE